MTDLSSLAGPAGIDLLAQTSVLESRRPLILRPPAEVDPELAAAVVGIVREAPTVTVLVGTPQQHGALVDAVDVCVTDQPDPPRPWVCDTPVAVSAAVAASPETALALAALLRRSEALDPWSALAAEAATYGLLLGSAAHRRWLDERGPATPRPHQRPPVAVVRRADHLDVVLDRPERRNAIDSATRDALVDALTLPLLDPTITTVAVSGTGPTFSAGGDLDEFGATTDPAVSLAVRLTCHPGWALHRVAVRATATLHGPCIGAGLEIPSFASRVRATTDATFRLPELQMGLIPGAGGTVSLPRRVGRHRTAWLALTGTPIGAHTALRWGLVDDII